MTVRLTSNYDVGQPICTGKMTQELVKDRKLGIDDLHKIAAQFGASADSLSRDHLIKAGFAPSDADQIFAELQKHFGNNGQTIDLKKPLDSYSGVAVLLKDDKPFDPSGGMSFPDGGASVPKPAAVTPVVARRVTATGALTDRTTGEGAESAGTKVAKAATPTVAKKMGAEAAERWAGLVPGLGIAADTVSAANDGAAAVSCFQQGKVGAGAAYTVASAASAFSAGAEAGSYFTGPGVAVGEGVQILAGVVAIGAGAAGDWLSS